MYHNLLISTTKHVSPIHARTGFEFLAREKAVTHVTGALVAQR